MLQERYSNADVSHPSPLMWGRDRAQGAQSGGGGGGGGGGAPPSYCTYNRVMPGTHDTRSTQQGTWYQVSIGPDYRGLFFSVPLFCCYWY